MNALASERLSQYVRYVIHPAGYDTKWFVVWSRVVSIYSRSKIGTVLGDPEVTANLY